jgi:hypothetical protein
MPKNPTAARSTKVRVYSHRRRRYYGPMRQSTFAAVEHIHQNLEGARSIGELRNRIRKLADDATFWEALRQYGAAMKKLGPRFRG